MFSPLSKIILSVWITVVLILGFAMPMVPVPQHWYELPLIPGLEEKARNIIFHVPMAWTTMVAFAVSVVFSIRYLKTKNYVDEIRTVAAAGLGTMFCILATLTGSLWAKFNWGSFWNWDPRETSIFILLLIYSAYFALRSAIDNEEKKATLSSAYAIIAGATTPFFIFVMPRVMKGLHPGSKGDEMGSAPVAQLHMPPNMLILFLASIFGFTMFFYWIYNLKVRSLLLEHTHQASRH